MIVLPHQQMTVFAEDVTQYNITILNDDQFTYAGDAGEYGGWGTDRQVAALYNGDSHWSNLSGVPASESIYYSFSFTVSKVELYGNTEAKFGIVEVSIDGQVVGTYDGYSASKQHQQKLWTSGELVNGNHTLKATLLANKNPSSQGYNTLIDFAKVYVPIVTMNEFTLEVGKSFMIPLQDDVSLYNWNSDNLSVASVDNGKVTASQVGEATITCERKQDGLLSRYTIHVIDTLLDKKIDENNYYGEVLVNDSEIGSGNMLFNYHGRWGTDQGVNGMYEGDGHWSDESFWVGNAPSNHYYTFTFTGRKIAVFGT